MFLSPIYGQGGNRIKFHHISLEHGLSQSIVNCILQDDQGFLWLGTQDGLNRYDGYTFKVFTWEPGNENSLSHSYIRDIIQDRTGMIWIGTDGGGLNRYDPVTERFTRFKHDETDKNSLCHNAVGTLLEDRNGNIWIGTRGNGLNLYEPKNGVFTHFPFDMGKSGGISSPFIYDMAEDRDGILWLATENGLNRFNPRNGRVTQMGSDRILCLCLDKTGTVWMGTDNSGLSSWNPQTKSMKYFQPVPGSSDCISHKTVQVIFEDKTGMLWIGTRGGGLNCFNRQSGKFLRYSSGSQLSGEISSNFIRSIYQDRGSIIWIGTNGGGVNKYDPKTRAFMYLAHDPSDDNSLKDNSIMAIEETNDEILWVGTGSGLTRYDFKTGRFRRYQPICKDKTFTGSIRIRAIKPDKKRRGNFWLASNNGLYLFDPGRNFYTCYFHQPGNPRSLSSNQLSCLYRDSGDTLWVGTLNRGFNRFSISENKARRFVHHPENPNSLSNNLCYFIHKGPGGKLWIGTYSGLTVFSPGSGRFERYFTEPRYTNQAKIISVCQDSGGRLWFGSMGGGLFSVDPTGRDFKQYSKKEGLGNNVVYGILEDDSAKLWLSTNKGLFRFDPKTGSFRHYDESDGLQSNEFNLFSYHRGPGGRLYFGGINGLNAFFPRSIEKNPHGPPLAITRVRKLHREHGEVILKPRSRQFSFDYMDYQFSFEFAALDFSSPLKNRYLYRLKGFNQTWTLADATRRSATYTNLDPGEYTFMVKGSNNHGLWNQTPLSVKVIIKPPFWRTSIFRFFAVMLVLFMGYFIYRLRVRSIKKKKENLEKLVRDRTRSLGEKSDEMELFNKILGAINAEVEMEDLLKSVVTEIAGFLSMERAAAYSYDRRSDSYVFKAGIGKNGDKKANGSKWGDLKKNDIIEIYIDPAETIMDDIYLLRPCENHRGHLAMAIRAKNEVAGYLIFESLHPHEPLEKFAIPFLQKLKEPLVSAFSRGLLMAELKSANEKAEHEQAAAEIANRTKSDFLARMSHEIRTPMNSVIGFTDMLMETHPTEEQADYIKTIHRSGEALLTLINDILDFSKVESGMLTLESIEFDPGEVAYDVCKLVQPRVGDKPVELLCRLSHRLPARVIGDPGRFRQVLVNLMGNAVKFTKTGEVSLNIDVEEQSGNRVQLHTMVTDTGIGIPKEKLENVFQLFQQAEGSTSRQFGGSGLGLTICRQLSQLMNGNVWAESNLGTGSTFHFTAQLEKGSTPEPVKPPKEFKEKRILVAENNIHQRASIIGMLESFGFKVAGCSTSGETLSALEEGLNSGKPFDLCMVDISMTTLNGHDIARTIRALEPSFAKIPLMALSSSAIDSPDHFRKSGFDAFVIKPAPASTLIKYTALLLNGEKPLRERKSSELNNPLQETPSRIFRQDSGLVMLVEDNPINRKLATFILAKSGYPFEIAENGKEAVDMFLDSPDKFSLILMDVQTPIMNGLEAVALIREKGYKSIPVIAMTAQSIKGDRERCIEAGMNDYIAKPIRKELLLAMIRKWTSIYKAAKGG